MWPRKLSALNPPLLPAAGSTPVYKKNLCSLVFSLKEVVLLLGVKLAPWLEEADESGKKTRIIYYTLNINYGFGQKCCPTIETQVRC